MLTLTLPAQYDKSNLKICWLLMRRRPTVLVGAKDIWGLLLAAATPKPFGYKCRSPVVCAGAGAPVHKRHAGVSFRRRCDPVRPCGAGGWRACPNGLPDRRAGPFQRPYEGAGQSLGVITHMAIWRLANAPSPAHGVHVTRSGLPETLIAELRPHLGALVSLRF